MSTLGVAQGGVNALWRVGAALARLGIGTRATVQAGGPPRDPVLAKLFGGGELSASGASVTPETALAQATVFTCVRILAETAAQMPLVISRRLPDGGKARDREHPLWELLHLRANRAQSSFDWREMLMTHAALRGDHTSEIVVNRGDGRIQELVPLSPDRTRPFRAPDGTVAVEHFPEKGERRILLAHEVLRIPFMSADGVEGRSPIQLHRETVGLALATREYGARFFGNSAQPQGALKTPADLDAEAVDTLIKGWEERHRGLGRSHRVGVLYGGLEWEALGMSNQDAQYIDTAKLTRDDIFGIYRVPPHMGGNLERATFNNIEHLGLGFVVYTMMPWVRRIEDRLNLALLSAAERKTHLIHFLVDGLLRGDFETRTRGYALGRMWGWWSANDILGMEDRPGIGEQGDIYLQPTNMVDMAKAMDLLMAGKTQPTQDGNGDGDAG